MANLVLNSESLNNVLDDKKITYQEALQIFNDAKTNPIELFSTAQSLRQKFKQNTVTFSKKAFFNIINMCKDTCTYCTYKAEPGEEKLSLMSKTEILVVVKACATAVINPFYASSVKPPEKTFRHAGFQPFKSSRLHAVISVYHQFQ